MNQGNLCLGKKQQSEECCVNVPKCSPQGTRFSLSPSPACCSCPDQFKRWEEDGLAVLFGEEEKAEPWGLFDLTVLEESVCFCRQIGGETNILYHVF